MSCVVPSGPTRTSLTPALARLHTLLSMHAELHTTERTLRSEEASLLLESQFYTKVR